VDDGCQNAVHHVRIAYGDGHIRGPQPVEVEIRNFLQSKAIEYWRGTGMRKEKTPSTKGKRRNLG
jgi:hypothetical protein